MPIRFGRVVDWIREDVFAVLDAARLQTVDVLPGLRVCECEVVGRDADDCTIFTVESRDVVGEAATDGGCSSRDSNCTPEEWAGEVAEGMEVDVVDCVGEDAANRLRWLAARPIRPITCRMKRRRDLQFRKAPTAYSTIAQQPFLTAQTGMLRRCQRDQNHRAGCVDLMFVFATS